MSLEIPDALSFFRLSCGRWRSQRSQHHLLHRRAEAGASFWIQTMLILIGLLILVFGGVVWGIIEWLF